MFQHCTLTKTVPKCNDIYIIHVYGYALIAILLCNVAEAFHNVFIVTQLWEAAEYICKITLLAVYINANNIIMSYLCTFSKSPLLNNILSSYSYHTM